MIPNIWPLELYTYLGSFLSPPELHTSMQVCKIWHVAFEPLVWSAVCLQRRTHFDESDGVYAHPHLWQPQQRDYQDMGPSAKEFSRHGSWVRSLQLWNPLPLADFQAGLSCDGLVALEMLGHVDPRNVDSTSSVVSQIISKNRASLRRIRISHAAYSKLGDGHSMRGLLSSIAMCGSQLHELELEGWKVPWQGVLEMMDRCPRLEKLTLERTLLLNDFQGTTSYSTSTISTSSTSSTTSCISPGSSSPLPVFKSLRHLRMGFLYRQYSIRPQLTFAQQCPHLKTLSIDSRGSLDHSCPSGTLWPALETVRMANQPSFLSKDILSEESVLQILDRFPGLKGYSFRQSYFGSEAYHHLRETEAFLRLEALDLSNCPHMQSRTAQVLLESCPNLSLFKVDLLCAEDIVGGKDWICQGLEELECYLDMNPLTDDSGIVVEDWMVFAKLEKMTKLRVLSFSADEYLPAGVKGSSLESLFPTREPRSLAWDLEHGLDQLVGLGHLEKVFLPPVHGLVHSSFEKEMDWMVDHWKGLCSIRYRMFSLGEGENEIVQTRMVEAIQKRMGGRSWRNNRGEKILVELVDGWRGQLGFGGRSWYFSNSGLHGP